MFWPQSQDYNEAIQNQATSFGDTELRHGEAVTNASGLPLPRSGNFADVYEFRGASGQKWAIKCFTRQMPRLQERYGEISKYLANANLPFTVDFTYLAKGIRVGSDFYPILKMKWVDGHLLNEVVRNQLDKPAWLEKLVQIWARMAERLHEAGIAHADLQHANVILVPGSRENAVALKLIDYDGMFIPALQKVKSGESGHPAYQHPERIKQDVYDAHVDRLPVLAIACALRSLAAGGKALWHKYDNGDNMLFREADLCNPASSPLFHELWRLDDPATHHLTGHLAAGLASPLHFVPLLSSLLHGSEVRPLSPSEKTRVEAILGVAKVAQCTMPVAVPVTPKKIHTPPPSAKIKTVKTVPSAPDWSLLVNEETAAQPAGRRGKRHTLLAWLAVAGLLGIVAGGAAALALMRNDKDSPQSQTEPEQQQAPRHREPALRLDSPWAFDAHVKEYSDTPKVQRAAVPEGPMAKNGPDPKPFGEENGGNNKDGAPGAAPTEDEPFTQDAENNSPPDKLPGIPPQPKPLAKNGALPLAPEPQPKTVPGPPARHAADKIAAEPMQERQRAQPPTDKALSQALLDLHMKLREDYAKLDPESRRALAARLLDEGRDVTDMDKETYQYACLVEARDLAVKIFDFDLAFEAVDELARCFVVNPLQKKADVITVAAERHPIKADQNAALAEAALNLMDDIEDADAYHFLKNIPYFTKDAAKKARDPALKAKAAEKCTRLDKLKHEFEKIKGSVAKLRGDPNDPEANLKFGKFLVFQKEFWGKGVRLLALGNDPQLKTIAKMEIPLLDRMATVDPSAEETDDSAAQLALADAWWNYATRDLPIGEDKKLVQAHAKFWYRKAEPYLDGADKEHAQKRLK